ncbi:hypothetical protein KOR34_02630 [Posidoniimonas corsicana]|uniref:3-keto-alpha-glucoside-1,2-lyase/3-keto-2-hydroxy-glucal hydratase domain-containing protein n=1 Tax=Posidoniimonas corsicana TaxID=1938618 RepID=A0A5C5VCC2_9BACT|nr:DUF1080 domain-containing protein [Posidoniimonas corsicana]TWT35372.1 hypothetical protein KOR34_02630 [Posidoniimonas corsicana]
MKHFVLAAALVGLSLGGAVAESRDDSSVQQLFNGKDLSGWNGDPRLWKAKGGVIRGETTKDASAKGNTFLIWEGGEVEDFELKLSYRCNAANNSGIQYRSRHITDDSARNAWVVRGYQHELRNENKLPNVTGFIYDEGGSRKRICLAGEKASWDVDGKHLDRKLLEDAELERLIRVDDWNEVAIIAKGNHIQHYLNGTLILDFTDNHRKLALGKGVLALQLHAGAPMWVEFKNLTLKRLD